MNKLDTGNLLIFGGAGVAALAALWPNISKALGSMKGMGIKLPFLSGSKDATIHETIQDLIKTQQAAGDKEGVMLLSAFGKHLYDVTEKGE